MNPVRFALLCSHWRSMSCLFGLAVVLAPAAHADNWPSWRGPDGTGLAHEKNLPTRWSTSENVRWHVTLPESGNSSPIVWGNRVFVTQPIAKENRRTLMCFDRVDGKLLWQSGATYEEQEATHQTNPYCSASPVTDGERVFAWFGSAGVYCYDFDGHELWHRDLGKQDHIWGYGSSPILHGDLCILNFGPGKRTFLIALNKSTGETTWQIDGPKPDPAQSGPGARPAGDASKNYEGERTPKGKAETPKKASDNAEKKTQGGRPQRPGGRPGFGPGGGMGDFRGSWSTPIVIHQNDRTDLVMSWPDQLAAYDPQTGKELWTCRGLGIQVYTSPIWGNGVLVAMDGGPGTAPAIAVRPGTSGDVTESNRIWQSQFSGRLGSGVISDGHIYVFDQRGVAHCIDLQTGKTVWQERLKGQGNNGGSWSSAVLNDGKLYVTNQSGDTFVLKAAPKFELLATNSLGESTNSSPAVSNGDIFIRTHAGLWCICQGQQ